MLEVSPFIRVGLVRRDDLDQSPRRMAALNVNRPTEAREAQNQTTRAVLVVRIVFDDLPSRNRFTEFLGRDAAQSRLIEVWPASCGDRTFSPHGNK